MNVILTGMPLEGKMVAVDEDTTDGSFGRLELRTKLVVKNEFLGVEQAVAFKRPGGKGEVLATLIDDFKADKEIIIKGKVSYGLDNAMFMSKDMGMRELFKQVKLLIGKNTNWQSSWGEKEKELLGDFLSRIIIPVFGVVYLEVSVDGKVKYSIWSGEKDFGGAKIRLHKEEEVN